MKKKKKKSKIKKLCSANNCSHLRRITFCQYCDLLAKTVLLLKTVSQLFRQKETVSKQVRMSAFIIFSFCIWISFYLHRRFTGNKGWVFEHPLFLTTSSTFSISFVKTNLEFSIMDV